MIIPKYCRLLFLFTLTCVFCAVTQATFYGMVTYKFSCSPHILCSSSLYFFVSLLSSYEKWLVTCQLIHPRGMKCRMKNQTSFQYNLMKYALKMIYDKYIYNRIHIAVHLRLSWTLHNRFKSVEILLKYFMHHGMKLEVFFQLMLSFLV